MTWISDNALESLRTMFRLPNILGERYVLRSRLGQGGMGEVFLADDRELLREVAVKILNVTSSERDGAERILREARIIARLEHPGIVPVHDVGRLPDGRVFYVMKRIRGRRLDAIVEANLSLTDRLRIFERICETVAFAHAHAVVHRDLKPQNVMVGEFGEVLILDWGVAKVIERPIPNLDHDRKGPSSRSDITGSIGRNLNWEKTSAYDFRDDSQEERQGSGATVMGTVIGTPDYMSPEQARGEVHLIDARSDVFSLGSLLWFMLAGRAPRRDPLDPDWCRRQIVGSMELRPDGKDLMISKRMSAICFKAMSADPEGRYETASALAEDVRRLLGGERMVAYRESVPERLFRTCWKYRTAIALVVAYLVMRVALILWRRV